MQELSRTSHPPSGLFVVSSGLLSGIGKGVITASIAHCLGGGRTTTVAKFDPYLNLHAGRLSPDEHGEVYVLADGTEVDLDFGTYERLVPDLVVRKHHALTGGRLFLDVIQRTITEYYGGDTVTLQHVRAEFRQRLAAWQAESTYVVLEIGGTVHDAEAAVVYQCLSDIPHYHIHIVPDIPGFHGEAKTRPIQLSVDHLKQAYQLRPDLVIVRGAPLSEDMRAQWSAKIGYPVLRVPKLPDRRQVASWLQRFWPSECRSASIIRNAPILPIPVVVPPSPTQPPFRIWLAGKYLQATDAYVSLKSAVEAAAAELHRSVVWETSGEHADHILIPGGFGVRGFNDKINAVRLALARGVPTLGICLGMQAMVVEGFRRHRNDESITSAEFVVEDNTIPVVVRDLIYLKLGAITTHADSQSVPPIAARIYASSSYRITERYRHRFGCPQIPPDWIGITTNTHYIWIEHTSHPWMVGVQFHPEFHATPHPLFRDWLIGLRPMTR